MNKLVSVIVPVYKVEKYLHRCIDSVLSQSYSNWELILVDDGSPDNCPAICDEYANRDERITVIHKENERQAEARNVALDIARGDYVMFLDSDDYLHSDTLDDIYGLALEENADMVQFSFIRGSHENFPVIKKDESYQVYNNQSIFYSSVQKVILCGKLYRTELWNGVRMPKGKFNYEDDATTWKLYYKSERILYVNTPYYYYYDNPQSTMANQRRVTSLAFIKAYTERISFFKNKGDKLLTDLSKWRFCLPLMLVYMRGNVNKSDLPVLLKHFRENVGNAIRCSKVPLLHRFLFFVFRISPSVYRAFFVFMGRAHNL